MKTIDEIYAKSNETFYNLSRFATKDDEAYRQIPDDKPDFRTPFAIDRDRILYSGAYRRYHGKTQVFSFSNLFDEEMTNRNLHTTYVSQISRTIAKILGLNLELVEAIALGHDLGHTPFGHDGERALSQLCVRYGIGEFHHNIESLHIVDHISRRGNGLNLTFQVRDGIVSHDGEVHETKLVPDRTKTVDSLQLTVSTDATKSTFSPSHPKSQKSGLLSQNKSSQPAMSNVHCQLSTTKTSPATLEGCVVRIADTIAYIGQDIEDAIRFNILKHSDIPADCKKHLGDTNGKIIDNLVKSVLVNSYERDYICFDEETSYYLEKLKSFNYLRIYKNPDVKKGIANIEKSMEILFEKYMNDIATKNTEAKIYKHFLSNKIDRYLDSFSDAEKVRDFIATMTDRYFNEEIKDYLGVRG